jgi:hypothetical protein
VDKRIKTFYRSKKLDGQEWHLTLEISTLEMAHARRERENTPAK